MCLKSTLDKMLRISRILSQLSVEKMDIVGEMYSNSKFIASSDDAMEGTDSTLDKAYALFNSKVVEVFILILELILAPSDNEQEATAVSTNADSYLDILKNLVSDLAGYSKQEMDKSIYDKYAAAENKLSDIDGGNLSANLILCKRAIFE